MGDIDVLDLVAPPSHRPRKQPKKRKRKRKAKPPHPDFVEVIRQRLWRAYLERNAARKKRRKRKHRKFKAVIPKHRLSFGPRLRVKSYPNIDSVKVGIYDRKWPNGSITESQTFIKTASQLGFDAVKRTRDYLNPGPPYRTGEMFDSYYARNPVGDLQGVGYSQAPFSAGTLLRYRGGFLPLTFGPHGFNISDMQNVGSSGTYSGSFGDATSDGPELYNRARPKIEHADATVFTAELRDLPGMLRTTAKGFADLYESLGGLKTTPLLSPKGVADHFLNHSFGWVPFVNDLVKFYDTYQNSEKYIAQIERDNGQWVKRTRSAENEVSRVDYGTVYTPQAYPVGNLPGQLLLKRTVDGHANTYGTSSYYTVTRERAWFVASFKYYLPEFDKSKDWYPTWYGKMNRYLAIYGGRINPHFIWKATPWTWLIDWVSNVGQHIEYVNATLVDQLVNRYAYVMKTTEVSNVHNCAIYMPGGDRSCSWSQLVMVKSRRRASPFGFGVLEKDFTPKQIAILGALGLSR